MTLREYILALKILGGGGGGGTSDHSQLTNRDISDQHPISAVTGLQDALDGKQPSGNYTTKIYVDEIDMGLQAQIDAITSQSDVVDVVATYADLLDYDTSALHNNDIVKVMLDSTHSDAITYYRWVITDDEGEWSYVGSQGPYYTKAQTDAEIQEAVNEAIFGAMEEEY